MNRLIEFIKLWFELRKSPVQVPVQVKVQAATTPNIIPIKKPMPKTNSQKLYDTAYSLLGKRIVANNAEDGFGKFGCAESVNYVFTNTFGHPLGGGLSTAEMLVALKNTKRFIEVPFDQHQPGDIVIAATGTSTKYPQAHGHVGICGNNWIMSNSSETGEWMANYPYTGWKAYFNTVMGFKSRVFRLV